MSSTGSTFAGVAAAGDVGGVGEPGGCPSGCGAHVQPAAVVDSRGSSDLERHGVDGDGEGLRGRTRGRRPRPPTRTSSAGSRTSRTTSARRCGCGCRTGLVRQVFRGRGGGCLIRVALPGRGDPRERSVSAVESRRSPLQVHASTRRSTLLLGTNDERGRAAVVQDHEVLGVCRRRFFGPGQPPDGGISAGAVLRGLALGAEVLEHVSLAHEPWGQPGRRRRPALSLGRSRAQDGHGAGGAGGSEEGGEAGGAPRRESLS